MHICLYCGNTPKRKRYRYCSNQCQMDYQYDRYIEEWKSNRVDGNKGIRAKNISGHLSRYLRDKFGDICSLCGWSKQNPFLGRVPLEVDHIDGNSENSSEQNLRLICANCHSLTSSYRNLNRGMGREWRRNKYIKNI